MVTVPGGATACKSKDGATLSSSPTVAFGVAAGDTLRLQQLLAELDYLPVASPRRARPTRARPGPGPARRLLVALARPAHRAHLAVDPGDENEITKAAVEAFETRTTRRGRARRAGGVD